MENHQQDELWVSLCLQLSEPRGSFSCDCWAERRRRRGGARSDGSFVEKLSDSKACGLPASFTKCLKPPGGQGAVGQSLRHEGLTNESTSVLSGADMWRQPRPFQLPPLCPFVLSISLICPDSKWSSLFFFGKCSHLISTNLNLNCWINKKEQKWKDQWWQIYIDCFHSALTL